MILQALYEYYQRKSDLPKPGLEPKEIPFVIELDRKGSVIQIEDARYQEGKKRRARSFLVPQASKKSVNVAACLLWGNAEYVLGLADPKKMEGKATAAKKKSYEDRLVVMRKAFLDRIAGLPASALEDEGVQAVLKFLNSESGRQIERFADKAKEIKESNPNLTFRLQGDTGLVCQRPAVVASFSGAVEKTGQNQVCLVTGAKNSVERLHPPIRGVWGAQVTGANIVSFNLDAFRSYGKNQGENAPVGKLGAFAYTTALNHLLSRDSKQRMQVGDATAAFWADRATVMEDTFADIFGEPPKDDPDRNTRAVKAFYDAPIQGVRPVDDTVTKFFVLGLAPNAARLAVRFWHVGTVASMAAQIKRHFDDIEIVHAGFEKPFLSIFRLLLAIAVQGKADNIPPNLGGDVMRSILSGAPYPATLLQAAIRRIRAEQDVTYARAAILKACLNRTSRRSKLQIDEKEVTVSLDTTNPNIGYRLGRLFAVLEKIQEEANPGINATIRDRFYGSASSTPVAVFSTLMKLKNHHLSKLENLGRRVNLERLIGQIVDGVEDFPPHLVLADQGRFAIGYYHQRQALFTSSKTEKKEE